MVINKIYIVTDAPMPIGMAPTNRILSYAKGFVVNNTKCEIVVFRKSRINSKVNYESKDDYSEGISYTYLFKSAIKSNYFVKRRLDDLLGDFRLLKYAIFKVEKNSAIIYYSSRTTPIFFLKIANLINKVLLLLEESEHPIVYMRNMNPFTSIVFSKFHYRMFDGYLIMTQNLMDYFNRKYPKIPKALIPMTVDMERFKKKNIYQANCITYIGGLNNEKDGVNILLQSIKKVFYDFPDYCLNLFGNAQDEETIRKYKSYIKDQDLEGRVFFRGSINSADVPEELFKSRLLVLARPDSIQAQNGFPTKLGEYLATGNPVVVTSVGEIPRYLKDRDSAFIAKPGDIDSLANKISEALSDDLIAKQVGSNGRKIAEKYFNNITQSRKILEFINDY